jgi:hypothetical protein
MCLIVSLAMLLWLLLGLIFGELSVRNSSSHMPAQEIY